MTPIIGYLRLRITLDANKFPESILIQEYNQHFQDFFHIGNALKQELFESLPEVFADDSERWANLFLQCAYHGHSKEEIIKSANGIYQAMMFAPLQGEVIVQFQELSKKQTDESLFKDILIQMSDAVFVTDFNGNFKKICPNVEFLFGFTEREVHELENISNLLGTEYREHLFLEQDGTDELIKNFNQTVIDKNGNVHYLLTDVKRVYLPEPSLLFVCRDFTDQQHEINDNKKNSTYLKTIINTIPDMVWLKDTEGKYLLCNHEFELFFGAKEHEIIGKKDSDFVDHDQADHFRKHDLKVMNSKSSLIIEEEVTYHSDRQRRMLETTKTPVYGQEGHVTGVLGVARDITQRNKIRQQLSRSSEKLNTLINTVHGVIWEFDLETRSATFISKKIVDILGFQMDYWQENSLFGRDQVATDQVDHIFENIMVKMSSWEPFSFELPFYHQQGHIVWIRTYVNFVGEKQMPGSMIIGLSVDITEQKNNINRIIASERKFQNLFNATSDEIYFVDTKGEIVECNHGALQKMGYTAEELQGQFIGVLDHQLQSDSNRFQQMVESFKPGSSNIFESIHTTKSGEDIPVEVNVTVVSEGEESMSIAIARDISDRKRSEQKFQTLYNSISDQIHYSDANGNLLDINDSTCRQLGYTREELVGQFLGKIDKNFKSPEQIRELVKLIEEDRPFIIESEQVTKDGRTIPVEVSITLSKHEDEDRFIAVCRDISERIQSEEKVRTLFNAISDEIHYADECGCFIDVNDASCEKLGYSKKELVGSFLGKIDPNFQSMAQVSELTQSFELDKPYLLESEHRTKDGRTFPVEVNVVMSLVGGKKRFIAVCRDISERKKDEATRRAIIDQSPIGIALIDENRVPYMVNDSLCKILEYKENELVGLSSDHLMHEEDLHKDNDQLGLLVQNHISSYIIVKRFITKTGKIVPMRATVTKIQDQTSETGFRVLVMLEDLTDIKKSKELLEEQQALLKEQNEFLKMAQTTAKLGHWTLNLIHNEINVSEEVFRIMGVEPDSLISDISTFNAFVHPDDLEMVSSQFEESLTQLKSFQLVHRILTKSGELKYVEEKADFKLDHTGKPVLAIGTIQDITQSQLYQEELKLKDSNLNKFFENVHVGISKKSIDKKFLEVNPEFERFTGYTNKELLEMTSLDITPIEYLEDEAYWTEILEKTGKMGPYQKHYRTKSGDLVPVLLYGVKTKDANKHEYYWSVVQDISESEQYKALLQQDNFKLKTALNTGKLFAFEINLKTHEVATIRDHNEMSTTSEGYSLLGLSSIDDFLQRIATQHRKYCQKGYDQVRKNESESFECEMQVLDESVYRWYSGKMIVIEKDENGDPSIAFMTLRDIEKEKNEKTRQIIGQEQERLKISRDIHDSIGQMLVGTRMMLKTTGLNTPELQEIDELMNDMIKESRLIINNFGISVAQSKDLKSTFISLAEKMGRIYHGEIIINWAGKVEIDDITRATNIFRIYQEALSNAIKYANTQIIRVNVRNYEFFFMDIIDYGDGYEISKNNEGFGTENMHVRAKNLNSKLHIESEEGKGTVVSLRPVY